MRTTHLILLLVTVTLAATLGVGLARARHDRRLLRRRALRPRDPALRAGGLAATATRPAFASVRAHLAEA